ncbi:MAG: DNA repair protein RecO, partial [Chloroflexota bacterium]
RSLEERHAAEPLYLLLRRAYELLDAEMAPGLVARWYEMHLLDELGQRPEVDRCVECDRVLEADERFRWVPPIGGVLCVHCPGPSHDRTGISLDAVKLLKAYQRLDIEAIAALRLSAGVERETEAALREFVRGALERDARSLAFLDEVRTPHAVRPMPS